MKSHFFSYLKDNNGIPVEGATIHVLVYPLGGGTASYAYIYLTESGSPTTSYESSLTTNSDGYFEFWFADVEEGGSYGYEYQREFKITWSGAGITSGSVDKIQLFDVTKREVDTTGTGTHKTRLISNILAKGWEDHRADTADDHIQYLKTNGGRFLTGWWDAGGTYGIICNTLKSRPGANLNLTNYNDDGIFINATTGKLTVSTVSKLAGVNIYGDLWVSRNTQIEGALTVYNNLTCLGGTFTSPSVAIFGGNINNTAIGDSIRSTGKFTTVTLTTLSGINAAFSGSIAVASSVAIGGYLAVGSYVYTPDLRAVGGYINNTTVGLTIAAAGKFTSLECDTLIAGGFSGGGGSSNEAGAFSATSLFSYTSTKTGTLTVSGNTVLGDAAGDTLTINGTTITCPNGLNFDAGTLFINSSLNYVTIGGMTGARKLEVIDSENMQLRLSYSAGVTYGEVGVNWNGALILYSTALSGMMYGDFVPFYSNSFDLGNVDHMWRKIHSRSAWFDDYISTSASYFRAGDGWITIGASATPTAPIDVYYDAIRIRETRTPANSGDSGLKGEWCWDENHLYVCYDTNSWKRLALTW